MDPEITSESLEVRQQIEKNLVAKISETLEPLLGAKGFRAGASVDCDLTSGEQQEETLDPSRSVMLSSQKTEDVTEHAASSGIPGTASNLPQQASSSGKGANGVSRRTENVTYQTSRVIRHTKIPQGVIRRMSLAVLVDQSVRWEGEGAAQRRVLAPPAPETLKTIKDLVAGVTGFNARTRRPAHRRDSALRIQPQRRAAQTAQARSRAAARKLRHGSSSPRNIATCGRPSPLDWRFCWSWCAGYSGLRGVPPQEKPDVPAELQAPAARTEAQPGSRGKSPPPRWRLRPRPKITANWPSASARSPNASRN